MTCNALLAALGACASAQATMNNVIFGDAATSIMKRSAAASAPVPDSTAGAPVQTHMTNTRMTDPEVLELRYPVRLEEFSIRRGSGGAGRWRGGDGARRRIRFLRPMQAMVVASRRNVAPHRPEGRRRWRARPAMGGTRRRHASTRSPAIPAAPSSQPAMRWSWRRRAAAAGAAGLRPRAPALTGLMRRLAAHSAAAAGACWPAPLGRATAARLGTLRARLAELATIRLGRAGHPRRPDHPGPAAAAAGRGAGGLDRPDGDGLSITARGMRLRLDLGAAARRAAGAARDRPDRRRDQPALATDRIARASARRPGSPRSTPGWRIAGCGSAACSPKG